MIERTRHQRSAGRLTRLAAATALAIPLSLAGATHGGAVHAQPSTRHPLAHAVRHIAANALATLPLRFEPNMGQVGRGVDFVARGMRDTLYLTAGGATLSLTYPNTAAQGHASAASEGTAVVRMTLVGGNLHAQAVGLARQRGVSNYFIGNKPGNWHTAVP